MTPFELKVLRKKLGISQLDAAKTLGIDRITYWRYENEPNANGESKITSKQLIILRNKGNVCPQCGAIF